MIAQQQPNKNRWEDEITMRFSQFMAFIFGRLSTMRSYVTFKILCIISTAGKNSLVIPIAVNHVHMVLFDLYTAEDDIHMFIYKLASIDSR